MSNDTHDALLFDVQTLPNGTNTVNDTLLFDLDSNTGTTSLTTARPTEQEQQSSSLLDFDDSTEQQTMADDPTVNLTSFINPVYNMKTNENEPTPLVSPITDEPEQQLLDQAYDDVDHAAQELAEKIDLVTTPSPSITSDRQLPPSFDMNSPLTSSTHVETTSTGDDVTTLTSSTHVETTSTGDDVTTSNSNVTSPIVNVSNKPTTGTARTIPSATKTRVSSTTTVTTKATEQKVASTSSKTPESKSSSATTKSTETRPSATTRKTIHLATATASAAISSTKSRTTPTSPVQETARAAAVAAAATVRIRLVQCLFFELNKLYSSVIRHRKRHRLMQHQAHHRLSLS
jgi:hypothetical protein